VSSRLYVHSYSACSIDHPLADAGLLVEFGIVKMALLIIEQPG
jgi:hypothetical protein